MHVTVERSEKEKSGLLSKTLAAIEKEHGVGSVVRLGDKVSVAMPCISTGLYEVDWNVLGIGGFPKGRIVEIYGPESSGKTSLALKVVAQSQAEGGRAAYIDVEHSLDPTWASRIGVNVDDLVVSQPDSGEQALSIAQALIQSEVVDIIVIDSVSALVPRAELEGDIGDSHMGLQARLMSQVLRMINGDVRKTGTVVIFINQIREKIGVSYGTPETTSGGKALKFYASIRLDVRRIGAIKDGEEIIGNKTKIKAVKNKVSAPFRQAEVDLLYTSGFDTTGSLLDAAIVAGVVKQSGSWFDYTGPKDSIRLGQGRAKAKATLDSDAKLYKAVSEATNEARLSPAKESEA